MKTIQMKLNDSPFQKIKIGSKTVEIRLNDEKRKTIEVGDFIEFFHTVTNEVIIKQVSGLKTFKDFNEVYQNYDSVLLGARNYSEEEYVKGMNMIYPPEKVEKYNVLAIELKCDDLSNREVLLRRNIPFEGTLLKVRKDTVKLPNSQLGTREWIEHIDACAIVYVDENNNIMLENQFRYPLGFVSKEIPAGKLNTSLEDHLECAKREFEEETGLISLDMKYLGKFAVSLAYSTQVVYLYYTNKVIKGNENLDSDEFLSTYKVPFNEALKMCNDGTIIDSKTIIAINLYNNLVIKNERNI